MRDRDITLTRDQLTLSPVGDDLGLPRFSDDDSRRILTFAQGQSPWPLDDTWSPATLVDGREIEVRAADCGAGCRCAGEYRAL